LFDGDEKDIALCNIWLRTADRVLIQLAEFKASDFEVLFQGVKKLPWEKMLEEDSKIHVIGKSNKSQLSSVPTCQSVTKKAILEALRRKYKVDRFSEDGTVFRIEVALNNDIASITLDTSGDALNKRGYRKRRAEAPLKETLAAALVLISNWKYNQPLMDPFCGSGTIMIEAALIGRNIAPGLNRNFTAEEWTFIPKDIWQTIRAEAKAKIKQPELKIYGSDRDPHAIDTARENAKIAGVGKDIVFETCDVEAVKILNPNGVLICNPPYGERIGEDEEITAIYKRLGRLYFQAENWAFFVLTANEAFEKIFKKKSDKNRKLYNGNIKCYYYQYFARRDFKNP